jgi:hypothetical protein
MCHMHKQVRFLDTKNNGTLPLDSAYPKHLNVWSPTILPYLYLIKREYEYTPKISRHPPLKIVMGQTKVTIENLF